VPWSHLSFSQRRLHLQRASGRFDGHTAGLLSTRYKCRTRDDPMRLDDILSDLFAPSTSVTSGGSAAFSEISFPSVFLPTWHLICTIFFNFYSAKCEMCIVSGRVTALKVVG
jgi:hypothetical protein